MTTQTPKSAALGSAGERFRSALRAERPLQVAGCINAYVARLAEALGYRADAVISLGKRLGEFADAAPIAAETTTSPSAV